MANVESIGSPNSILVIGGGISGITAAVEAAEVGYDVLLIEQSPYLGGRVVRANQYFPKLCSPNCGLEINFRRIKTNPKIRILTQAQVESISGKEGDYEATVKLTPRLVNDNCTACNKCAEVCPAERPNDFNYGLDKTKAIYLPHSMAFPLKYVVDSGTCLGAECSKCVSACQYGAIDLGMFPRTLSIKAGSVIVATGWKPYDAAKIDNLGFGKHANIITNVMMERLAAIDGPTQGKIVRPSDGKEVKSIAFVQCAGSRDENHLPYCSGVCCLGSLKQVSYVKEKNPDAKVFVFYIDIRAPGILEDFYHRIQGYEGLSMVKGKVAKIEEDPDSKDLTVEADDTSSGRKAREKVEMVVLATGIVPTTAETKIPADLTYDDYGFVASELQGICAAGCSKRPADVSTSVQDATAAALRAIQSIVRREANG
ncbi:MAG: CoB--CoM heterodisulfide reductase iron-sulfur subunit A family protein [Chloroflexota bacterium]